MEGPRKQIPMEEVLNTNKKLYEIVYFKVIRNTKIIECCKENQVKQ